MASNPLFMIQAFLDFAVSISAIFDLPRIIILSYFPPFSTTKAELLQLNQTQFPLLGIFVSKKAGNQKN